MARTQRPDPAAGADWRQRFAAVFPTRRRLFAALPALGLAGLIGPAAEPAAVAANRSTAKQKKNNKQRCKRPKKRCGKACVNVKKSNIHCGACGNGCEGTKTCAGGFCFDATTSNCTFTRFSTKWVLQDDCTLTSTLEVPPGVLLDGDNHTITLGGATLDYWSDGAGLPTHAGILLADGPVSLQNVTLSLDELTCSPGFNAGVYTFYAVAVSNATSIVENVTVARSASTDTACYNGLTNLNPAQNLELIVDNFTFTVPNGMAEAGISLQGEQHATLRPVTITGPKTGIILATTGTVMIQNTTINETAIGIGDNAQAGNVTVRESSIRNAAITGSMGLYVSTGSPVTTSIINVEIAGFAAGISAPSAISDDIVGTSFPPPGNTQNMVFS